MYLKHTSSPLPFHRYGFLILKMMNVRTADFSQTCCPTTVCSFVFMEYIFQVLLCECCEQILQTRKAMRGESGNIWVVEGFLIITGKH